jgi:NAD(P)H-dependent flavin oxidoreductase YrpB (nitropropane dioxygenase family)
MKQEGNLKWSQVVLAANTPMLLRAGLVEGRLDAGVLSSGQVVGAIDDLPTVGELIERIMNEASDTLQRLGALP